MERKKKQAIRWIEENQTQFFQISDAIWEHPELSMQEYFASNLLANFLTDAGYRVERNVAGMPSCV